jgi:nucleotide-binding universal stress UspA family protein
MRRVLVPLDGTKLAESVLPEARRLAGDGGVLILLRDPINMVSDHERLDDTDNGAALDALASLELLAAPLRQGGMNVETRALVSTDPADAIDIAAHTYGADVVAFATHGRGSLGRMLHRSVVRRALAHSSVPVLVHHVEAPWGPASSSQPEPRILVPLDGSHFAERAVPLAKELADEWAASIWLVHVVSHYPVTGFPRTDIVPQAVTDGRARLAADQYLREVAARYGGTMRPHVLFGPVSEHLVAAVRAWDITHVVMTSHGRTGLSSVVLGSVADDLTQLMRCPLIIVPLHASIRGEQMENAVTAVQA